MNPIPVIKNIKICAHMPFKGILEESDFGVTLKDVFLPIIAKTADLINIGLDMNVSDMFLRTGTTDFSTL